MILFEEDWAKYPSAIIDINTKNKSFVRLAAVYKSMGIKNHAFLLALINPSLQGVDPYDPDLTEEQITAISVECKINPWYFFREIARAPALAGTDPVMMEANRANIALYWSFFNHIFFILIQPRQTGKSFSTDVLMRLLMNVLCQSTQINLLTKDDTLRRANIQRLKDIAEELPFYLQFRRHDDANNGEEITVNTFKNTYKTHVPQMSPKRALLLGRGLTSPIMHIDEAPFQPNIAIALPAALAATGAAIEAAIKNKSPYGVILTTTAGKKDDKDGKFVYGLVSDAAVWDEAFLDSKNAEELAKRVRGASRAKKLMINGTFNHRQLGKTDEWLARKLEESLQTGEDANRDYFNIWTSGTEKSPFPAHMADMVAASVESILFNEFSKPDGYVIRWYIPEDEVEERMANGKYLMTMDTSEASGGDDISLLITDVETLETIGAGTYNETNLIVLAKWVCSLLVRFENVTGIIERRSTGGMLLDYLLLMLPSYGIDPFKRLFNRVVNEYDEFPERYREIKQPMNRRPTDIYVRYKKTFGFATSGSGSYSRGELYSSVLMAAMKRAGTKVKDKTLVDQILGLVIRNGRIDHEVGEHDDMVIAWLLTHWFLTQGKNLSFYGIDITKIGSAIRTQKELSYEELEIAAEQKYLRERIEDLQKELIGERDTFLCARIEHELRSLERKIILEDGEMFSVDELIRKASEARRGRGRNYDAYERQWGNNEVSLTAPRHAVERISFSEGLFSDRRTYG